VTPGQVPTEVSATDGLHTDKVVVTWNFLGPATQYKVYRSTDPTNATPDLIATVTTTTYEDHPPGAAGTSYAYFVKATVNGVDSALSVPNMGFVGTGSTPPPGTTLLESQGFTSFTVPADGNYVVEAWGAGGGGGPSFLATGVQYSAKVLGSSGGGGGFASLNVTLKKDDLLVGSVGVGGRPGTGRPNLGPTQGETGGTTLIAHSRGGVVRDLVRGLGGSGGRAEIGSFEAGVGGFGETPGLTSAVDLFPGNANPVQGNSGAPGQPVSDPPPNPLPPPLNGGTPGFPPPATIQTAGTGGKGSTQFTTLSFPAMGTQGTLGCVRIRTI
jgi:hypothetical protein